ncbi:hypothetical protein AGMMS49925_01020 [Deltaproteobacteria bacterium]|nr:hypothetical protein AGMMS49925_01020 [Deltaproteobacteria bacterium]
MRLRFACVYYARKPREAGTTKYPFRKMAAFAAWGVTASGPVPLRLSAVLSLVLFVLAVLSISALKSYFSGDVVPGWTPTMALIILYLGAMQLFCMAVIGEYIAKIFTEVKQRPRTE